MYKIEKNISLVPRHSKNNPLYPFKNMEIGDSFFVPFNEENPKILMKRISACSQHYKPFIFAVRTEKNGVRCWRIK